MSPVPPSFDVSVEQQGVTALLQVRGDFDLQAIGHVEAAVDGALLSRARRIVFDLSGVTFLDLAGLMTVLRANERSRAQRFDVLVVPPRGLARRVFTLTRAGAQLKMVRHAVGPARPLSAA
jgi:anti-anti-sigma factor